MSFGDELRRERELRRISLREVAEATKVNIRYLEAMERNDFVHLPGGVFNRGFVRAYAQFIGIDPEAMVNAYLLEEQAQVAPSEPAPATQGNVLRGSTRAPARTAPPLRPTRARTGGASAASVWQWGLLLLATAILAVVGYLVFDVLQDRPGAFPAGRSSAPQATGRDG